MPAKRNSQRSAGAERGDPRAIAASSREAKRKTTQDAKLIRKLFNLDPIDWARYPDNKLAFIRPDGSKVVFTQQQLETIQAEQKPQPKPPAKTKPLAKTKPPAKAQPAGGSPAKQGDGGAPPPDAAHAAPPASTD